LPFRLAFQGERFIFAFQQEGEFAMSSYNPRASTAGTSQAPGPDTQTVIGLLGSLMPLLLQIQWLSREQLAQSGFWQGSPYQREFAQSAPQPVPGQPNSGALGPGSDFGNLAPANPTLDHQAAVNFVEDITADSLRTLSTYLENYAGQHQGLESCIPMVTHAARCFAAHDYGQTVGLIWQVYRVITALRAGNPQLPPLRAAAAPITSSSTVIH
jgi:hypothetical protein